MSTTFRIVAEERLLQDRPREVLLRDLAKLLRVAPEKLEPLVGRRSFILGRGLAHAKAQAAKEAVERAGVACRIEQEAAEEEPLRLERDDPAPGEKKSEVPPAGKVFTCPKCHFTGPLSAGLSPDGTCPACGIVAGKYRPPPAPSAAAPAVIAPAPAEKDGPELVRESALPSWPFRWLKWGLTALGVFLLLHTGISVFELPTHEVLYRFNDSGVLCPQDPRLRHHPELASYMQETNNFNVCLKSFTFDIVNAGIRPMPQTVVRLNLPPERVLVMQPTFLNAGRNPRQVQARRRDDVVSYALGPMAPFDHVALRLKVIVDKGEDPPATEILKEIAVAKGEAQQGDAPKTTVIARILLGFFTTDPKDSLEMLADAFLDGVTGKDVALDREFDQSEADLALLVSTSGCDQQRPGGPCHMTITVDNHGPGDASDITLDFRVPADLTVLSSTLEIDDYRPTMAELAKEFRGGKTNTTATAYLSPHCTRQGENAVRCAIKSLMPGRSAVARLSLRLPPGAVPECRAEVSSPRTDPDPADNTIAFSMPRKEPAPSRPPAFRQQGAVVRPPGNEFAGTWVLDQDGNRRARILINPDLPRQARKTASQGPISIEASSSIALLTNRFNPVKNTASLQ